MHPGYTPGIGGPEEGKGKGTKLYGVVGMVDGPGCVSKPLLVTVAVVLISRAEVDALKEPEGGVTGVCECLEDAADASD
jgi:hypothetical protein